MQQPQRLAVSRVSNRLTGDIGYVGAVKQAQFLKGRSVLGATQSQVRRQVIPRSFGLNGNQGLDADKA